MIDGEMQYVPYGEVQSLSGGHIRPEEAWAARAAAYALQRHQAELLLAAFYFAQSAAISACRDGDLSSMV